MEDFMNIQNMMEIDIDNVSKLFIEKVLHKKLLGGIRI